MAAKLKFEDGMKRLQEIVAKLENGEETLEEAMKLFEEGAKLPAAMRCWIRRNKRWRSWKSCQERKKMTMKETFERYRLLVEDALSQALPPHDPEEPDALVWQSMAYSLQAGGKRIRPVMALAFCALCAASPRGLCPLHARWKWSIPTP